MDARRPPPRETPVRFRVRAVTIGPGGRRAFEEAEWRDAMVVVDRGEIELECVLGSRRRFDCGSVLWLAGLRLVAIHNPGREPAVLLAVSRRERGESHSR